MEVMQQLSDRLAGSDASIAISSAGWVIPTVQSVHILAIAVLMSSVAMLNLRLAGLIAPHQSVQLLTRRFLPWMWWALPVLLLTGLIMILGEPARELMNVFFWSKMTMVVLVVALTIPLQRLLEDRPFRDHAPGRRSAIRAIALMSLMIWLAIIFCGRWIAYS